MRRSVALRMADAPMAASVEMEDSIENGSSGARPSEYHLVERVEVTGRGRALGNDITYLKNLRWERWDWDAASGFGGVVEAGGAEGVAGPGGVGEAGVFDELDHAGWAGEALDRGGEVAVSGGLAGDEAA